VGEDLRLLLAVKSCRRDQQIGCHEAIRETWGANLPEGVDVRFFMGGEGPILMEADEVLLLVPDDYWTLTPKTRGIFQYTVQHGYDFVYSCDTDTYLVPSRMLESDFEKYDFSGGHLCHGEHGQELGKPYPAWTSPQGQTAEPFYSYMSGGVGMFLSHKACNYIENTSYYHHSEDVWVGQVVGPLIEEGILTGAVLKNFEGYAAWHLNCGYYGGGHAERLSPAEAVRRKHNELRTIS
jgi:hypothetical protein